MQQGKHGKINVQCPPASRDLKIFVKPQVITESYIHRIFWIGRHLQESSKMAHKGIESTALVLLAPCSVTATELISVFLFRS